MAKYCVRCGYKVSFFKNVSLKDGAICNDCLQELGLSSKDNYDVFSPIQGTYEMLLAEAKINNPDVLELVPGERRGEDYQTPEPMPTVRTIHQILDEDLLVEQPGIHLYKNEKCYYKGNLYINYKVSKQIVKSGGAYKGISINLGHGLRYSVGGRKPSTVKTKESLKSDAIILYLTNQRMIIKAKDKPISIYYDEIEDLKWNVASFDLTQGGETVNINNSLFPINDVRNAYQLIQLSKYETVSKPKETHKKKSQKVEEKKLDNVDEIRRYKQLLDDGIITQEEFEQKKKQLLNL